MREGEREAETSQGIQLSSLLDSENPLVKLAAALDWKRMRERFQATYSIPFSGRVLPDRMLLGLVILRQIYELSDAALYNLWQQNPYFQHFCGCKRFLRHAPFDEILVRMLPRLSDRELQVLLGSNNTGDDMAGFRATPEAVSSVALTSAEFEASAGRPGASSKSRTPAKITDVAKLAGVSVKTVSLVLNRHSNVSEKTRQTVHDAMRTLSYKPNVFARGLATLQSNLIAILYEHEGEFISALETGALNRCREAGFQLLVESLDSRSDRLFGLVQEFISRSALHGVILIPPLCDMPEVIDAVLASHIPCVTISAGRQVAGISNVGVDEFQIGYDVTDHLATIGHRRIGYIGGLADHYAAAQRKDGYLAALKAHGIQPDASLCETGAFTMESGREAARTLLQRDDRPTAIFACSDQMAAGVLGEAQRMGLNVPKDVSVAGVDDSVIAQIVWPQLTTCHQPIRKMAYAAVSLLTMGEQDERPAVVRLEHKLVERGSSAPPR